MIEYKSKFHQRDTLFEEEEEEGQAIERKNDNDLSISKVNLSNNFIVI